MILRIVKLQIQKNRLSEFLLALSEVKSAISTFEGCKNLSVLQSFEQSEIIFTLSEWENEEMLENYRKSDLFSTVWEKVKPLFAQKAKAVSIPDVRLPAHFLDSVLL